MRLFELLAATLVRLTALATFALIWPISRLAFLFAMAALPLAGMWIAVRIGRWLEWGDVTIGVAMLCWLLFYVWNRPIWHRHCLRLLLAVLRLERSVARLAGLKR